MGKKRSGSKSSNKRAQKRVSIYGNRRLDEKSFDTGRAVRRHYEREEKEKYGTHEKEYILDDDDEDHSDDDKESEEETWGGSSEARAAFWDKYDAEAAETIFSYAAKYNIGGVEKAKSSERKREETHIDATINTESDTEEVEHEGEAESEEESVDEVCQSNC